mgnify:CR=1 FL=1
MSVVEAVEKDLRALAKRASGVDSSALAATALMLARELDNAGNSATSKSMCARVLVDVFDRLEALVPENEETDSLDDLSARRAARLAGGSAA